MREPIGMDRKRGEDEPNRVELGDGAGDRTARKWGPELCEEGNVVSKSRFALGVAA